MSEATGASVEELRHRILRRVVRTPVTRPWAVLGVAGAITLAALAVVVGRGKEGISTDLADVIPHDSREAQLYLESVEDFAADALYVGVEVDDPARMADAREFIEAFAAGLEGVGVIEPDLRIVAGVIEALFGAAPVPVPNDRRAEALRVIREVGARNRASADADELASLVSGGAPPSGQAPGSPEGKGLADRARRLFESAMRPGRVTGVIYGPGEQLRMARELVERRGYLFLDEDDRRLISAKLEPEAIRARMAKNRELARAGGADYFRRVVARDPLGLIEVYERRLSRGGGGEFRQKEGENLIVAPDGRLALMVVKAGKPVKDLEFDGHFMAAVREAEAGARARLLEADPARWTEALRRIDVRYAGGYAVAVSENEALMGDIFGTFGLSLGSVLLLFVVVFRRPGSVVYIGLPLAASVLWTLAVAYLLFGHISIMSAGFAAILVGLSVDYGIHVYNRFVAERTAGLGVGEALTASVVRTGDGIFFGMLTTAVAFFAITWTRFRGLAEFGVLAGLGVALGMLAMFYVLPALLAARDRVRPEPTGAKGMAGFGLRHLARGIEAAAWPVLAASSVLAVTALACSTKLDKYFFDSDFSRLRSDSEVFRYQDEIQERFGTSLSSAFVFSRGATSDEALANAAEVRRLLRPLMDGIAIAGSPARLDGAPSRPWVSAEGCVVRVRRAEIPVTDAAAREVPLAGGAKYQVGPDGTACAVYSFESEAEMADWEIEGSGRYLRAVELESGARLVWRREVPAPVEVAWSVWFLGEATAVSAGLGGAGLRAPAPGANTDPASPWPPRQTDQVRLVLDADPARGLALRAGAGTVTRFSSRADLIPPRAEQEASAALVAGIDVGAVRGVVEEAAAAEGFRPAAFSGFFDDLAAMAERARAPEYLTLEELTASPLSPVVSQFYKLRPDAPGVRRHTVVTSVYDEPGELPMERYLRVRAALAPGGDYTAPRMVSYEMRDLVHRDLVWMMALVGAGVMASLLWSFRSLVWSLVALAPVISGLAMLISLMLLTSHMFNYMNALVMPVILGIGIDNGIHVIARFRQGSSVREIVTETGRALMMTSLTTMVGFGSLVSSRYRGLASLGLVATVGMALCLFTSLVALPSLLAVIERARRGAGREGA